MRRKDLQSGLKEMSQNGLRLRNMIFPFQSLPISTEATDFRLNKDEFEFVAVAIVLCF